MKKQHGSELTGAEMAQMLDEFCNSGDRKGSKNWKDFVEQVCARTHRTLQQKIMALFLACIEGWASDEFGHDARNEATVKLCQKICQTFDQYDRTLPYI